MLNFSLFAICYFSAIAGVYGLWPRPNMLDRFYPLDASTGTDDICYRVPMEETFKPRLWPGDGPFGISNTSYSVSCDLPECYSNVREPCDKCWIGRSGIRKFGAAFTISFYIYSGPAARGKDRGAIAMFWDADRSNPVIVAIYKEPNILELWGGQQENTLIGRFPIFTKNKWNFVAVTYHRLSDQVNIYNEYGVWQAAAPANITWGIIAELFVGYARWSSAKSDAVPMRTTDAMACLMYYYDALTPSEIAQLPNVCKTKGDAPLPVVTPWPRPQSLLGYWPLNYLYNGDISQNAFDTSPTYKLASGPFGDQSTAATPRKLGDRLLQVTDSRLSAPSSFSVSLFFKKSTSSSGGIFEFVDRMSSTDKAFQFRFANQYQIEVSANGETIGKFEMVQQKGAWTFATFVFDSASEMLTIYGRHGVISPASHQPQILASNQYNNNGIRLGYASRWSQGLEKGDAVSCLSVYPAALTGSEVRQLYEACRIIHGSAACGTPKIALSPIPTSTSATTIGKSGQFPYVASIRLDSLHVCSASIIDAYWLVTSAQCFPDPKSARKYTVYVGAHDLSFESEGTRQHSVAHVIVSGMSSRDIALVQLVEPIDFTNQYVNDVCLFREENAAELKLEATQFVFGWGRNGRPPLVSETLPRYIPGAMMTDSECANAWGYGNYTTGRDFCYMSASADKNVPCTGDEGSPLLVQAYVDPQSGKSDRLIQIGTYYKRDEDCSPSKPGLFTNIAQYSKWISEQIACAVPGYISITHCPQ